MFIVIFLFTLANTLFIWHRRKKIKFHSENQMPTPISGGRFTLIALESEIYHSRLVNWWRFKLHLPTQKYFRLKLNCAIINYENTLTNINLHTRHYNDIEKLYIKAQSTQYNKQQNEFLCNFTTKCTSF